MSDNEISVAELMAMPEPIPSLLQELHQAVRPEWVDGLQLSNGEGGLVYVGIVRKPGDDYFGGGKSIEEALRNAIADAKRDTGVNRYEMRMTMAERADMFRAAAAFTGNGHTFIRRLRYSLTHGPEISILAKDAALLYEMLTYAMHHDGDMAYVIRLDKLIQRLWLECNLTDTLHQTAIRDEPIEQFRHRG